MTPLFRKGNLLWKTLTYDVAFTEQMSGGSVSNCLCSIRKALGSSIQKVEAEVSRPHSHPWLPSTLKRAWKCLLKTRLRDIAINLNSYPSYNILNPPNAFGTEYSSLLGD